MFMVKIQIPDRTERAQALVELGRRGRVICLPEDTFIVAESALPALHALKISFVELERGGLDYAEKSLRDAAIFSLMNGKEKNGEIGLKTIELNQALEHLLDQAEASGETAPWTREDMEDIRREIRQRHNQVGAKP